MIDQINARRVFVVPVSDDDDVVLQLTRRYAGVCVSNDRFTQDIYQKYLEDLRPDQFCRYTFAPDGRFEPL